jgi:hypothetical protein
VIEEQRRAGGHVDQLAALWREISLPAEGGYQVTLERQRETSADSSTIDGAESPELHPGFQGIEPGPRVGSGCGHAAFRLRASHVGGMTVVAATSCLS